MGRVINDVTYLKWEENLAKQVFKHFESLDWSRDPEKENKYAIAFDDRNSTIPKELYDKPTITREKLYGEIRLAMFKEDLDYVKNDLIRELEIKCIRNSPKIHVRRAQLAGAGMSTDYILQAIIEVESFLDIDMKAIAERSGIEVID